MPGPRPHTGLRVALGIVALVATACARPEGLWRDQYAFIGDDGTVLALALHRQTSGAVELKGWLGRDGRWTSTAYDRLTVARATAADSSATLAAWADTPGAPARAALTRADGRVALDLRLPSREVRLRSSPLAELGRYTDPEGTSVYRAARAQMTDGDTVWHGWLVVEETPRERPRQPFVDYGDFAFAVLAGADRPPLVVKRSRAKPAYNQAFVGGEAPRHTYAVALDAAANDHVAIDLSELDLRARPAVLDRDATRGTAPDGSAVVYETLLLGGEYAGIAFVIRPERRTP